jgi:hypothetical protein
MLFNTYTYIKTLQHGENDMMQTKACSKTTVTLWDITGVVIRSRASVRQTSSVLSLIL